MNRTGRNRLLKLAGLLEQDAKNKKGIRFDLRNWVSDVNGNIHVFEGVEEIPLNCNTQACAVGLACVSGEFKRSGLSYDIEWSGAITPKYDGYAGWNVVEVFFGLSYHEAAFLFLPSYYPHNKIKGAVAERFVAKRIRDFAAGKVAP